MQGCTCNSVCKGGCRWTEHVGQGVEWVMQAWVCRTVYIEWGVVRVPFLGRCKKCLSPSYSPTPNDKPKYKILGVKTSLGEPMNLLDLLTEHE